jgi:hypothetical protein
MAHQQPEPTDNPQPPLQTDKLTWAALLGRWVDFARSAVALPESGAAGRVRESIVDIIMLQAVWFALHHMTELPPEEQALGLDRAEVLIEKHAAALAGRWSSGDLPRQLQDVVDRAWEQLRSVSDDA